MKMETEILINGSKEDVWRVITDIEGAVNNISGIEHIDILEQPADGLEGLKWEETRTLFGRTAKEIMWITDVRENESYVTRAESHGAIYRTRFQLTEQGDQTLLQMEFSGEPQTFMAKLMSATMGRFFKGATEKALVQDLQDIKAAVEKSGK